MCFPQGSDVKVEIPANLGKFTEALMAFTTHSSQVCFYFIFLNIVTLQVYRYKNDPVSRYSS